MQAKKVQPSAEKEESEKSEKSNNNVQQQVPLPFPSRVLKSKKVEIDQELLDVFKKVEINIPLLDAIKQIPKYAKFLKELCTYKRNLSKRQTQTVSSLSQTNLPQKCDDPGTFTIPCTIGELIFANALVDLGASINVMPATIYKMLKLGDLRPTNVVIHLANRSTVQPLGVLEDVLVRVNQLIFLADFYIIDMQDERSTTLILGRPFLMTARTKIDVHTGMLSMEFGDDTVQFNIFEAMKHPIEGHSILFDHSILWMDVQKIKDVQFVCTDLSVELGELGVDLDSDFDFLDLDIDTFAGYTCDGDKCIDSDVNTVIPIE